MVGSFLSFERSRRNFLHHLAGTQLIPPFVVEKARPSDAVTLAAWSLVALTATRSTAGTTARRAQFMPSVVIRTVPLPPTIQHTVGDGAEPAAS
jgi:hypothetical protein